MTREEVAEKASKRYHELKDEIRKAVITTLWADEYVKRGLEAPADEIMERLCQMTFSIPCTTRQMKRLFEDAHELMAERNEADKVPTIPMLEWCLKYRCVGYSSVQSEGGKYSWLPGLKDVPLMGSHVYELVNSATKLIDYCKNNAIDFERPVEIKNEAMDIVKELAMNLGATKGF